MSKSKQCTPVCGLRTEPVKIIRSGLNYPDNSRYNPPSLRLPTTATGQTYERPRRDAEDFCLLPFSVQEDRNPLIDCLLNCAQKRSAWALLSRETSYCASASAAA